MPHTPDSDDCNDERYLALIRDALRVCLQYVPAFGQGKQGGVTLDDFQRIYGSDEFYTWFGLDSPLVYSAHKAAGGMTSVYRQIGMGCQLVFQNVLQDTLALDESDATWSYVVKSGKKTRTLSLDGRIPLAKIKSKALRTKIDDWLSQAMHSVGLGKKQVGMEGCVFEVRQGYKSNDAKRQNADVANAASAFAYRYLPVMALLSVQIPDNLVERYQRARWLMLRGTIHGTPLDSTYVFCQEVLGYDLAGFFRRNAPKIKAETHAVFEGLLR